MARNVRFEFRRGAGSSLEVLFGKVSLTPTMQHNVSTSVVLPAPTTLDLVNGVAVAANVAPSPDPVDGRVDWAYLVKVSDSHGKSFEFLAGVPDGTSEINFNELPKYFESKPPLFGQGPQGVPGNAATIQIGTVGSGVTPSVTNVGTSTEAILDFTLSKGDKGDQGSGTFYLDPPPLDTDAPSVYATGISYFRLSSNAGTGWPLGYSTGRVTAVGTGRTVMEIFGLSSGAKMSRTAFSSTVWGPWVTDATDALATPTTNGLMPALDKAKLDGLTPAANSKTFAALASTYPAGFSVVQVRASDGWPIATTGTVVTQKTATSNDGVGQWLYPVEGGAPAYRVSVVGGAWENFSTVVTSSTLTTLDVRDFGAVGDGSTNDTVAIQAAIDAGSSFGSPRVIVFPDGQYVTGQLNITTSDVTITGETGAVIIPSSPGVGNIFNIAGTAGDEIALSANKTVGDTTFSTASAHGFSVGDLIQFKSQRDSLSSDAGEDWRLGYATPGSQGCYFGEYHEVISVESATAFTIRQGLMFPDYRVNNSMETAPTARDYATVRKINAVRNATISNLEIRGGLGNGVRTNYADNALVENVLYRNTAGMGSFVFFTESVNSKARNCRAIYDGNFIPDADHHKRNAYKTAGTQLCGFEGCYAINSTQPFDLSYLTAGLPSIHGYVNNCETRGAQLNTLTTHGGTYAAQITNNRFFGVKHGPSVRTRNSVITGNIIEGAGVVGSMGIYLYEGWARDCVISDNIITGFETGIRVMDAADAEERFQWIGALITDNVISKVQTGVHISRSTLNTHSGESGAVVQNNIINLLATSSNLNGGVVVDGNVVGSRVAGNTVRQIGGPSAGSNAILLKSDASHTLLESNYAIDTYVGIKADAPTGRNTLDGRVYPSRNIFRIAATARNYVLGAGVVLWDGGYFGSNMRLKGANPGTATGSDAAVINTLVATMRSFGFVA